MRKLLLGAAVAACAVSAHASLVMLQVSGTAWGDATHLGPGNGAFEMRLVYDTAAPDFDPDPQRGAYESGPIQSWTVQFNGSPAEVLDLRGSAIYVYDGTTDSCLAAYCERLFFGAFFSSPGTGRSSVINLYLESESDTSLAGAAGVLADDTLGSLDASRLAAFDSRGGNSTVSNPAGSFPGFFAFMLTGFVITSLEPMATVPEPGTGLLAAAALAALALPGFGACRKHKLGASA